jgi:hypothetical protein
MQSRGCRAATRASVCDHGWFCRGGGLDFFGCSFRSDAPRSRLPFSRGAERSGDARRRPTGCLEERPSFDPRSKSAPTTADDGLVPAQLAQRCCSALRRRRKIAVEAIAALRRANYGPPAFRRPLGPCGGLGRSQAVRQRILIPPSGGSNPPAPANYFNELRHFTDASTACMSRLCRVREHRTFGVGEFFVRVLVRRKQMTIGVHSHED